ncbi:transposase [Dictyobacter aurantiacus]|uniref:Transposase n=1 Tax=Dictyobacter aurantiacus TaxID=1936993 RepID=A0A401ZTN0_9CHLR|nr:transposase [Dictyobacter aurantiacus]GCE10130.1 transposase [Dictyobacter aurantiacus]
MCQTEIARVHQLSLRTVQRWVQAYREEGLWGLGTKKRADAGQRRGLPKELVLLIEGLALQAVRRPLRSIHRMVCQVAREQHWKEPSYAQVSRIVGSLPKDLVTLGQAGAERYRERFDVVYRREARRANAIWQADHCQLRCYVRNAQGRAQLPLLSAIEDDYSRSICGYRLSFEAPSSSLTALTLHQAINPKEDGRWPMYGIPECLYTDHGSDFTSKHVEAIAVDLKIALVFSQVGRPRGRGKLERFFRTVREQVLSTLPGYAPKIEGDRRRQREIEAQARSVACLTLEDLEAIFEHWLLDIYHQRVHAETQATPHARWVASGIMPMLPENERQVEGLLLYPRRRRVVHQEGIVLQGAWYMHELLAGYVGEAVMIRYDPRNLAMLWVYVGEQEESLLCEASCVERGGQEVSLQALVSERTKRRKAVGNALRERKAVVVRYASPKQQARRELSRAAPIVNEVNAGEGGAPDQPAGDESGSEVRELRDGAKPDGAKPASQIRWYEDE